MPLRIRQIEPSAVEDWAEARRLVEEYAASLGVDLEFQNFSHEIEHLAHEYGAPRGAFLLADEGARAVGCVAVRELTPHVGEVKRLYVVPAARGHGVARALAMSVLDAARRLRYARVVLDTLPSMAEARALYLSLGFAAIAPYRFNPIPGTAFLELRL